MLLLRYEPVWVASLQIWVSTNILNLREMNEEDNGYSKCCRINFLEWWIGAVQNHNSK